MRRLLLPVVLLFVLAGCRSSAHTGVVPWLDRPLPTYVMPVATLIRYPTTAPLCHAAQLRVTLGRTGAGLGNDLQEFVFSNVGAKPCLLRGYPTISAETGGARRALRPMRGGTYFGRLIPADLAPGKHVFLDFGTSRGCQGGAKPAVYHRRPVFTLPRGGSIRADRISIVEYCGLDMSEFGRRIRYAEPRAAPGSAGTLHARLELPASVRAGTVLRYVVVLSNPTKTTVAFSPCPGYTEYFFGSGAKFRRSFALNCGTVHALRAHAQVRCSMQLTVPLRVATGIGKLGWNLDTPTGPFAGAAIQITG